MRVNEDIVWMHKIDVYTHTHINTRIHTRMCVHDMERACQQQFSRHVDRVPILRREKVVERKQIIELLSEGKLIQRGFYSYRERSFKRIYRIQDPRTLEGYGYFGIRAPGVSRFLKFLPSPPLPPPAFRS